MSVDSYDLVPYPKASHTAVHIRRLEASARLFGMKPTPIPGARVLEIGTSAGTNLIPQAIEYPDAQFVGIDLSGDAIAAGQIDVTELGLSNIELRQADLMSVDASWGEFDYILCHGVYSWVPEPVQQGLLQLCGSTLTPQGVAIVTYNTYPGWGVRSAVRNMMLFHTAGIDDPAKKTAQARAVLDFAAANASPDSPYGQMLAGEVELLRDAPDGYLYHDYLERSNNPIYFHDFITQAERARLQYLGNAQLSSMIPAVMHKKAQSVFKNRSLVQQQQYSDFLLNRSFRLTHLCHSNVELNRTLTPATLEPFHPQPAGAPGPVEPDGESAPAWGLRFGTKNVRTNKPHEQTAVQALADSWPRALSMPELGERARAVMLQLALNDAVLPVVHPARVVKTISRCPKTSPFARLQAGRGDTVTNQLHENIQLDPLDAFVLSRLDGTRDSEQISEDLRAAIDRGELKASVKEKPTNELTSDQSRSVVRDALERQRLNVVLVE
ncbi:MAG: methyltransferase regulatory domain-containing protein [Deltaproteobacteria bacterium]|nr:methyltransferase regulatory domain-containing protein [Deltaproteobacteria bacterium]